MQNLKKKEGHKRNKVEATNVKEDLKVAETSFSDGS